MGSLVANEPPAIDVTSYQYVVLRAMTDRSV
jgi:hypothetical protein